MYPFNLLSYSFPVLRNGGLANANGQHSALESMQMPLNIIKMFWPEEKRDELVREMNPLLKCELEGLVVDGVVQMEFDGCCAWGWKP